MKTAFPFYAKASLIFIGLYALTSMLFIGQEIIVPIIYALIIAVAVSPVVSFLEKKKLPRIAAISLTLALTIFFTVLLIVLLSNQLLQFSDALPKLEAEFRQLLAQSVAWLSHNLNISTSKINLWVTQKNAEILNESSAVIGQTLMNTGSVLVVLVLIPVYVFMILVYQNLLIEFIHKLFSADKHSEVGEVLTATKVIIQSYLVGLSFEALIVAALNSASLLLLGIDYAILLGVIGAILNVIPYLGGIIAVTLPMLIALATKSPTYALLVLAAYVLIQLVDNNFIIPKVVASKVQINAFISIVAVLVGGAFWGLPGMFLSIPLTAIVKVICDHIEPLKPWGFLLGNIVPTVSKFPFVKRKIQIPV